MTQRKDVANNIEQAAQDIMVYLLTYRDNIDKIKLQNELNQIFELAKSEYSGEKMSYFKQYFIYSFSRKRNYDLTQAIKALKDCGDEQYGRFVILVDLLSNGACKSTSLNTLILDQLIAASKKYNSISEDKSLESEADKEFITKKLKAIFLQKALHYIEETKAAKKKEEEEKRREFDKAVSDVPKSSRLSQEESYREIITKLNVFMRNKGKVRKELVTEIKKEQEEAVVQEASWKETLTQRHAMLLMAFQKKNAEKPAKDLAAVTVLPSIYEEKIELVPDEIEQRATEPKSIPGKLNKNAKFAVALDKVGIFIAKKARGEAMPAIIKRSLQKQKEVEKKFPEAYEAMAKHFKAKC